MSQAQNSPVGKLFFHDDSDGRDTDVIVVDLDFGPDSTSSYCSVIRNLTLLTSAVDSDGNTQVVLQRFSTNEKPVTMPLDADTLHLLSREASIVLEKRIKGSRNRSR